ncbi:MAG TPA: lipid A biosynthesis acyltransferase [Bacteroidales bacterium]|nr:lipid A biosynthesis acyltransferase [Bacteroidales bacterium]HBZ66020.1 lipid A biosynthesis acyltransferase [Bacteroidales bacterium]
MTDLCLNRGKTAGVLQSLCNQKLMAVLNFILFLIAGLFMVLFWLTPFWLLYRISDLFRLVFWRLAGYRKSVVMQNLHDCFPDEPEENLKKIEKSTYRNLTDIITEGIKGFTMTDRQFIKRYRLSNPETIQPYFDRGQSFIAVTAHFNNWEWGASSASLQVPFRVVAFYKTLSNPYIDNLLRRTRERRGTSLVSIRETSLTFEKLKDTPTIFLMAADQNPGKPDNAIWVKFLGRETAFLHGPEKHARANNLPVVYAHIVRKKRGWYDLVIEPMIENPNELPYGEITRRYASKLEEEIRANPGSWLWSHRRWKHRRSE